MCRNLKSRFPENSTSCICNTSLPRALHNLVFVNQIVDKNPLRIVSILPDSNKINSLRELVQNSVNELYKRSQQLKRKGLKAEKVLFWLVQKSFQIHCFFGFSIIVQKNRMIQVALCEKAFIKTNSNHQNKTMLLFNTYTPESEFDRHLEHMASYHGMQSGLPVFLVSEFGTFEIFMQK